MPTAGLAWLEIEVEGLGSDRGQLAFALFDSEASFATGREPARRTFRAIVAGSSSWRVEDLPVGEYAVKAYHDVDGDGELDLNFVGAPTEPYGVSNGARGRLGPPSWNRARFVLQAPGLRLTIAVE